VHHLSKRPGHFVAVNCGAIPATLVETELFGYKRGAFSGAVDDRPGIIRSADKGTLLLDEIGELPLSSQVALLRVLQEREVTPVGATRPVPVDVRVVAATHRRLSDLVEARTFRPDLLARLSGYTLRLPPLRDRTADLGLLISAILHRIAPAVAAHVTFSGAAARALFRHPWPLNIRELEKALETALVLSGDGPIDVAHLPEAMRALGGTSGSGGRGVHESFGTETAPHAMHALTRPPPGFGAPAFGHPGGLGGASTGLDGKPFDQTGDHGSQGSVLPPGFTPPGAPPRDELVRLLREHGYNVSAVARATGKGRTQIQRWMRRYGITLERSAR
jgi:transcriptional regulator with GAF, ATPase, and Fis domain